MNEEELKQRLVELLEEAIRHADINHQGREEDGKYCGLMVDHLIANGVTIRERGEWVPNQEMIRGPFARNYTCPKCGHSPIEVLNFCPLCGADMRCGVMRDETVRPRKNIEFETGDIAKIAGNTTEHGFEIGTIVRLEKCEIDYKAFVGDKFWWVVDDDLEPIEDANMRGGKDEDSNDYKHRD